MRKYLRRRLLQLTVLILAQTTEYMRALSTCAVSVKMKKVEAQVSCHFSFILPVSMVAVLPMRRKVPMSPMTITTYGWYFLMLKALSRLMDSRQKQLVNHPRPARMAPEIVATRKKTNSGQCWAHLLIQQLGKGGQWPQSWEIQQMMKRVGMMMTVQSLKKRAAEKEPLNMQIIIQLIGIRSTKEQVAKVDVEGGEGQEIFIRRSINFLNCGGFGGLVDLVYELEMLHVQTHGIVSQDHSDGQGPFQYLADNRPHLLIHGLHLIHAVLDADEQLQDDERSEGHLEVVVAPADPADLPADEEIYDCVVQLCEDGEDEEAGGAEGVPLGIMLSCVDVGSAAHEKHRSDHTHHHGYLRMVGLDSEGGLSTN